TNSWMNDFGKIRRYTDRNAKIIDFYPYLAAAAIVTIRQLIQRARTLYRWNTRPTTRRLR
ncbi:IS5/IS1182 family transposase, partial [Micromonospora sp. DT4]